MLDVFIDDFAPPMSVFNGATLSRAYAPIDVARGAVFITRFVAPVAPALWLRSAMDQAATALQIMSILDDGTPGGLGWSTAGPMQISALLDELDGTEKGGVSYRVGMGIAHLLSQDLLGALSLGHFDRLWHNGDAVLTAGASRPDLVGQDGAGNWLVVEAKGRSNGVDESDLVAAKRQAENVGGVGLSPATLTAPLWRVASVADMSTVPLHVHFLDPPGDDDTPRPDVLIDPVSLLQGSFELVDEAVRRDGPSRRVPGTPAELDVQGARLPGSQVWVGKTAAARAARTGDRVGLRDRLQAQRSRHDDAGSQLADEVDRLTSIGPDGSVLHIEL